MLQQASAYEEQGRANIARLATKFSGYRCVKRRMPPTKQACGSVQWLSLLEHQFFFIYNETYEL